MGPMDLFAPADEISRGKFGIFQHPFEIFTFPADVRLLFRREDMSQKIYRYNFVFDMRRSSCYQSFTSPLAIFS